MNENRKYRVVITDDEESARKLISLFLKDFNNIEIIGEAEDGFTGFKMISEQNPDLVFLDVQMPKLNGFEMFELLKNPPSVIFVTAYDEFAVKAFEINAIDYILKPFTKERFREAVNKAVKKIENGISSANTVIKMNAISSQNPETLERIAVKRGKNIHIIAVEDIYCIEAHDDYTMIYTEREKFLKEATMTFFETRLDSRSFIRIHRSHIVNIHSIEKIELFEKESYYVILKNQIKLKAGRNGYRLLKENLGL